MTQTTQHPQDAAEAPTAVSADPWEAMTGQSRRRPSARRRLLAAAAAAGFAAALFGIVAISASVTLQAGKDTASVALTSAVAKYTARAELIPKLMIAVQEVAPLERGAMDPIVADMQLAAANVPAAGQAPAGRKFEKYAQAQGALGAEMQHLVDIGMGYPKLKGSAGVQALAADLTTANTDATAAASGYNAAADAYNSGQRTFPDSLVAPLLGHSTTYGTLTVK